ncbi:MAG: type II secretion system F family protein [Actinomycetota bacterium]|jgi:tight adherence protein B|nr:type II secretion system F family protein [Actinomycetota bacterium]
MTGTVGALAIGLAAALVVRSFGDQRRRAGVARRARAQLGLIVDADGYAQETRVSLIERLPAPKVLLAIVIVALVATLAIGPIGIVAGVAPWFAHRTITRSRARRRSAALNAALAPALQLVIDQLRVGRTLVAALDATVPSVDEPLASIVQQALNTHRLGTPLADVLEQVATEENNRHLDVIASALGLHARQGGSLTEILATVVEAIEEDDRLRRDMLTLTADARLSANVLLALPIGALIITSLLSPGYATPLIATPLGRLLSMTAVTLGTIGVIWLRHLARPETA